jgi:methylmalonyl-CoA/ethylmalonyl-CoA epimerase
MKTLKVDHIGIAVKDAARILGFYRDLLGLTVVGEEEVPSQQVRTIFLPTGDTEIELLEALGPDSPVAKFIEKRGEGVHHIAWEVEDLAAALEELAACGVSLIDAKPRPGAGGKQIAFIHPRETGGVLVELCQKGGPPGGGQ